MAKTNLPPDVLVADTQYPTDNAKRIYDAGDHGRLEFINTHGFGWCIATLAIGGKGRTYAVRCSDGAGVRIGGGPHVLGRVTVYLPQAA